MIGPEFVTKVQTLCIEVQHNGYMDTASHNGVRSLSNYNYAEHISPLSTRDEYVPHLPEFSSSQRYVSIPPFDFDDDDAGDNDGDRNSVDDHHGTDSTGADRTN